MVLSSYAESMGVKNTTVMGPLKPKQRFSNGCLVKQPFFLCKDSESANWNHHVKWLFRVPGSDTWSEIPVFFPFLQLVVLLRVKYPISHQENQKLLTVATKMYLLLRPRWAYINCAGLLENKSTNIFPKMDIKVIFIPLE